MGHGSRCLSRATRLPRDGGSRGDRGDNQCLCGSGCLVRQMRGVSGADGRVGPAASNHGRSGCSVRSGYHYGLGGSGGLSGHVDGSLGGDCAGGGTGEPGLGSGPVGGRGCRDQGGIGGTGRVNRDVGGGSSPRPRWDGVWSLVDW
jgi:hypothetical protein